jgi:hypothetical protein
VRDKITGESGLKMVALLRTDENHNSAERDASRDDDGRGGTVHDALVAQVSAVADGGTHNK